MSTKKTITEKHTIMRGYHPTKHLRFTANADTHVSYWAGVYKSAYVDFVNRCTPCSISNYAIETVAKCCCIHQASSSGEVE